jgi:hypothetical protein
MRFAVHLNILPTPPMPPAIGQSFIVTLYYLLRTAALKYSSSVGHSALFIQSISIPLPL